MGSSYQGNTFNCNSESDYRHPTPNSDGGHRLRLSVAIWMVPIGRFDSELQTKVHRRGAKHIRKRLDPVGHEREGMTKESGSAFAGCQETIRSDAKQRGIQVSGLPIRPFEHRP